MPADIVNLNKVRKAKERIEKKRRAEENRAKHGRTKAERVQDGDERRRREKLLDEAQLIARAPPAESGADHGSGTGA
ncbi:MAG TPA: DUF4169 family protein [Hyphomicrobium sp.]|nr:DUF4169 family protein [Hyphomicrobium sp.]